MNTGWTEIINNLTLTKELMRHREQGDYPILVAGMIEEAMAPVIAVSTKGPAVVLVADEAASRQLTEALQALGKDARRYPGEGFRLYHVDEMQREESHRRLLALQALRSGEQAIVVASLRSLSTLLMAPEDPRWEPLEVDFDQALPLEALVSHLVEVGYEPTTMVEGPGSFSHRGDIVDVFIPGEPLPHRLEYFGDELDGIRIFDPGTQRTETQVDRVSILPATDFLWPDLSWKKKIEKDLHREEIMRESPLWTVLEWAEGGQVTPNREWYLPYIEQPVFLWDFIPDEVPIYWVEPMQYHTEEKQMREQVGALVAEMIEHRTLPQAYRMLPEILGKVGQPQSERSLVYLVGMMPTTISPAPQSVIQTVIQPGLQYRGQWGLLSQELKDSLKAGYKVLFLAGSAERKERFLDKMREEGLYPTDGETAGLAPHAGELVVGIGKWAEGMSFPKDKVMLVTEGQFLGQGVSKKPTKKKQKGGLRQLSQLQKGDYVVHETYGIAQYQGTTSLTAGGATKDYLELHYAGTDKLYLPVEQLGLLHLYVGAPGAKVALNRLHSQEWSKTKTKAKKAVEVMARELIELYGIRHRIKGYAFSSDTPWQKEFEDAFAYEPTEGQLEAVAEIKRDMESDKPMDRLLCADVGYGKTEVALRAAFKAVMDGKQVAFLVPTTILANQHYATAVERLGNLPMKVGLLNRFRTPKEQQETIKGLEQGYVDMVIGTHRLLSKDVKFRDLGLLIIDEEQRFGVKDKERLKELSHGIDTLTLSATPIPRTLQMAMSGIRDMTTIDEPPAERYPVQTMVAPFSPALMREAILRELGRSGQVYVVHNRVSTMMDLVASLEKLAPEASFAMAHGQMDERALEKVMVEFYQGKYQVLVASTIIEIGMDIPNVNTMIVMDAHRLGLSQLYQLRGRVGRGTRPAYAYFTYPGDWLLSETATKRLMAMKQFTAFGSGFHIAMKDLEIRGAGNVFGMAQHGHMNAIGYDLYMKFLGQAVAELKGEEPENDINTQLELKTNAYIPHGYIGDEGLRLEIYERIAELQSKEDEMDFVDELTDRFGEVPEPVLTLIQVSRLRYDASTLGIESIKEQGPTLKVLWAPGQWISDEGLQYLVSHYQADLVLHRTEDPGLTIRLRKPALEEATVMVRQLVHLKKN